MGFRRVNSWCGIYAPAVSFAPEGWTWTDGEGAMEVSSVSSSDGVTCYKKQAFCDSYTCPSTMLKQDNPFDIRCASHTCTSTDDNTCCEPKLVSRLWIAPVMA